MLDTNRLHESLRGAVDRFLNDLGGPAVASICASASDLARRYADDWGAPPGADLTRHADRVALAISYHWFRFKEREALTLPEVVDRVRSGRLSRGERRSDVLGQVALAEGVCQWDENAVRRFRDAYQPVVDGLAKRAGGRRAEQEMAGFIDELMTPRVKAGTCRLDGFGGLSPLEDWLKVVVAKEYASRVRRDRLQAPAPAAADVADPRPPEGPSKVDEYREHLLKPLTDLYAEAVAGLGEWDRTVWKMIVLDGSSQTEVARVFGVDKSTVNRHFNAVEEPVRVRVRADPSLAALWESLDDEPAWLRNDVASMLKPMLREKIDGPAAEPPSPARSDVSGAVARSES